jgi:hypothetical protein
MKYEKYFVVSSYVSYEAKTSVTVSPVFDTAIETLLWFKKTKADASPHSSEKSYSFYEVCNYSSIDSTKIYATNEIAMEVLARDEYQALLPAPVPPVEIPPIV